MYSHTHTPRFRSGKKSKFLFFYVFLSIVINPALLFSQADVTVSTILHPAESQGFLFWNTSDSLDEVDSDYPNPLDFNYKLLDLNGVILDSQDGVNIDEDKVILQSDFPVSYSNEYLVLKIIIDDNSTKEILIYAN